MIESQVNLTYKIKATEDQKMEMLEYYNGYLNYNASDYIIARAKLAAATITFYKTNVVLFQGIGASKEYSIWAKKYDLPISDTIEEYQEDYSTLSAIGSDEVGTGDYFGPIVVCATYVSSDKINQLKQMGVKDSKLLTDKQMIPLALKIKEIIPHSIIMIRPDRINKLNKTHSNINFLKAYLHNRVINSILKKVKNVKYDAILIDQFTPRKNYFDYLKDQKNVVKNVTLIPKGESVHIAIAAASVLARVAFIAEVKKLSNKYDIHLLKGAGREVDKTAISFVKSNGWDNLANVAKLKWANTKRIYQYFKENPLPPSRKGNFDNFKLSTN